MKTTTENSLTSPRSGPPSSWRWYRRCCPHSRSREVWLKIKEIAGWLSSAGRKTGFHNQTLKYYNVECLTTKTCADGVEDLRGMHKGLENHCCKGRDAWALRGRWSLSLLNSAIIAEVRHWQSRRKKWITTLHPNKTLFIKIGGELGKKL